MRDLPDIVLKVDILVVATRHAHPARGEWVKLGAIAIDVGINRIGEGDERTLVGDVAIVEMGHVGAITPALGGVGLMTIVCLLKNTLRAAYRPRFGQVEPISTVLVFEAQDGRYVTALMRWFFGVRAKQPRALRL